MKLKSSEKSKKRKLLNFKVTSDESAVIKRNADQFADGNVSEWVRYAALHFRPNSSELIT
jgi:hypothetical protein